jgi:hypothetical protein
VRARLKEATANRVLQAEDDDVAAPHQWEAAARTHGRWSWLDLPQLAGSLACGNRRLRG